MTRIPDHGKRTMETDVQIGKIAIAKGHEVLTSSGIGSCLVITLYDPKRKIGALAHSMLSNCYPSSVASDQNTNDESRDTKYIDIAINEMIRQMETQGANRADFEAKLIGGANMFSAFESDIGKENILSAKEKLKKEGIKLIGEAVGGSQGRSVEFSIDSGIVAVKVKF